MGPWGIGYLTSYCYLEWWGGRKVFNEGEEDDFMS